MRKLILIGLVGLVGLGCVTSPVLAIPSDEAIKASCQSAQSVLNQVEKADAALRINRGRVYNEVIDLFYAMNARLAANRVAATDLVAITSDFDQSLTKFRTDYNAYDDQLGDLISMQCTEHPSDFYDQLTKVRDLRSQLDDDTDHLDQLLDDYAAKFDEVVAEAKHAQ